MIGTKSFTLTMAAAAATLTVPMSATAVVPAEPQVVNADAIQLVESAGIVARELKPGWTIEGQEIVWPDGTMASLGPMAYKDCDAGYLCFWADKSYGGRRLQFQDQGLRNNMADYSFNDQMSSWRSRLSLDARWYYNTGGDGTHRCIESGAANSDVGAGGWNFDNDEMSSFRNYKDDTSC